MLSPLKGTWALSREGWFQDWSKERWACTDVNEWINKWKERVAFPPCRLPYRSARKSPFCHYHCNNCLRHVSSVDAKTDGWNFDEEDTRDILSKYLSPNYLLPTEKKTEFTMEISGRHHPQEVKKANCLHWYKVTSCVFWYNVLCCGGWGCSCQKCKLNLSKRKISDKCKLRDILQDNWSVCFKNIKVKKTKKTEESSRWKSRS